jgi:ABC-type multidrug transport system permease subunit
MEGIYMRVMRSLRSMIRLAIFNGYIPMRNNPLWVVSSFLSPFSFLWITVSFMVFLISTYIKSERLVWPLASILGLGLSVFPPVYYPVTILPEPVRWIAIIPPRHLPPYHSKYIPASYTWTIYMYMPR